MAYFIRRYQSGVKNSGTQDILTSEVEIPIPTFVMLAESTGPGKYLLCERGPGIRGFRKITDCVIEPPVIDTVSNDYFEDEELLFAAENSVSVKRNLKLSDMSNEDLMDLMSSMESASISSDAEFSKFRKDLAAVNREMRRRMMTAEHSAENAFTGPSTAKMPVASAMFGISPMTAGAIGALVGGLGGVLATAFYYRSKIDNLGAEMESVKKMLSEAEVAIKRAESNAEKAAQTAQKVSEFDQNKFFDMNLLSNYQTRTRPGF
jgi:hypothetical protein